MRYSKQLILMFTTLIISLLIVEGVVRITYPVSTQKDRQIFDNYFEPIPNMEGVNRDANSEYANRFFQNSMGLYSPEIPLENSQGEYRILLVGDSFTQSVHTRLEQKHTTLLETKLRERYGDGITVINGGNGATGTSQQLLFLQRKLLQYEPDLILLNFHPADIPDNVFQSVHEIQGGLLVQKELVPYKHRIGWRLREWMGVNSQLYVLFWRVAVRTEFIRWPLMKFGIVTSAPIEEGKVLDTYFVILRNESANSKEAEKDLDSGWTVTKLLIKEMERVSKKNGAEFGVVILPYKEQVDAGQLQQFLDFKGFERGDMDIDRPQRMIKSFLETENISYTDLLPAFRENNKNNSFFFEIDPHWVEAGESLVASEIYDYLVRDNLITVEE